MTAIEFCNTRNIDFETLQDALKFKFFDNIKDKNDFLPEELLKHLDSCLINKYFMEWRESKKDFYLVCSCIEWIGAFRKESLLNKVETIAGLSALKYYKSLGYLQYLDNNFFDLTESNELDSIRIREIRFNIYHAWAVDRLLENKGEYFIFNRQNHDFLRDTEFLDHFKNLNYFMLSKGMSELAPSKIIDSVIYLVESKQLPSLNHGLFTIIKPDYVNKFKSLDLYHQINDNEEKIFFQYLEHSKNEKSNDLNLNTCKRFKTIEQIYSEIWDLYLSMINISIPNLANYLYDQYIENNICVDDNIDENKAIDIVSDLLKSFEKEYAVFYHPFEEHSKFFGPQNYSLDELKKAIRELNENKERKDIYNTTPLVADYGDHTNEEIIMRALEDGLGEYFGY